MQKKFIDFIMKHLKNKPKIFVIFFIFCLLTTYLISCSHIFKKDLETYNYGYYSEAVPYPKKLHDIYCTIKDKRDGKKADFDSLSMPCGREKIKPLRNRSLAIKRIYTDEMETFGGDMIPWGYHLIVLKDGKKTLQEIKVESEEDLFWYEVKFVKIREGVYWSDLDNDGYLEFAVVARDIGSAIYYTAKLYSLKENLFEFYGEGRYLVEAGEHVLLNCPKCRKHNLDECKKCE